MSLIGQFRRIDQSRITRLTTTWWPVAFDDRQIRALILCDWRQRKNRQPTMMLLVGAFVNRVVREKRPK